VFSHPFTASLKRRVASVVLVLTFIALGCWLLTAYGGMSVEAALLDGTLSFGLMALAGYGIWFTKSFTRVWQARCLQALLIQCLCPAVGYYALSLAEMVDTAAFLHALPLRCLFGWLCWMILGQTYHACILTAEKKEAAAEAVPQPQTQPLLSPSADALPDAIDRITVKAGSEIHIILLDELYCVLACGDYVTLFTPSGQYVKEQTMKYFETHLPANFVRIHRSSIVNTNHILRVELFGKENYHVKLRNGNSLRASLAGYKLLKERLSL
jgi:hypothetical protein